MFSKDDLIELVQQTMPFGKFQGRRLCDLPEEYLLWFSKKGFPQGQLGYLLQLMLEIRIHGVEDVLAPLKQAYPAIQHSAPDRLQ